METTVQTVTFALPQISIIGKTESQLESLHQKHGKHIESLLISLKDVEYIDISTMVFLIAITFERHDKNRITKFELPNHTNKKKNNILLILHTWRFFQILKEITNKNIQEYIINPECFNELVFYKYKIGLDGTKSESIYETSGYVNIARDYFNKIYKNDEGLKTLHFDKKFFPLISNPFDSPKSKIETLHQILDDWKDNSLIVSTLESNYKKDFSESNESSDIGVKLKDELITNVLKRNFNIDSKLENNVIKESITNAIRHPNANILITGSFYNIEGNHFTIVLWDNGNSIVKSLRKGLEENGTILVNNLETVRKNLHPSFFKTSGLETSKDLDNIDFDSQLYFIEDLPKLEDPDWRFLLASFYPGVTSKPFDFSIQMNETEYANLEADKTGMGLSILIETIIKNFDGQVSVKVDNLTISIKRIEHQFLHALYRKKKDTIFLQPLLSRYKKDKIPTSQEKKTSFIYQIKITENKYAPNFRGNMLTLRIPLK